MMNKLLAFGILCTGLLILNSCGETKKEDTKKEEVVKKAKNPILKNTIKVDLSVYNLPLMITIPDTTNKKMEVIVQDWGETEIRVGKNFQIKIAEGGDVELRKADLADDLLFTEVLFHDDEPSQLRYAQSKKDDEHFAKRNHFYIVKSINGIDYEIQDIIGEYNYPEKAVKFMFEAAKETAASAIQS